MSESFCMSCGEKRIAAARFCTNCGHAYNAVYTKVAETMDSKVKPSTTNTNSLKIPGTAIHIVVNITLAVFLLFSQSAIERYIDWGGDQSPVLSLLAAIVLLQFLTLYLQKRRKSYSLLLPVVISLISIFTTSHLYKEFKLWAGYQGYQTQEAIIGDIFLLIFLIGFYVVITLLNVWYLFVPKKNK